MRLPGRDDIDAVILGAGGVLLLPDAEVGRDAFCPLGYQPCDEDWARAHYANVVLYDSMQTPDWRELRRAFARALGVADHHLDAAVVDSHLVEVEKPDPAIFHLALQALGADAGRAVQSGTACGPTSTARRVPACAACTSTLRRVRWGRRPPERPSGAVGLAHRSPARAPRRVRALLDEDRACGHVAQEWSHEVVAPEPPPGPLSTA